MKKYMRSFSDFNKLNPLAVEVANREGGNRKTRLFRALRLIESPERFVGGNTLLYLALNSTTNHITLYDALLKKSVGDCIVGNTHQRRAYPDYNIPQHYPAFLIDVSNPETRQICLDAGLNPERLPIFES